MKNRHIVYLGIGTNLGNKEENLNIAIHQINQRIGKVISLSHFYASEPWGFTSKNSFLNAVCCIHTHFSPFEILSLTQSIERTMGRLKKSINGEYHDRIIDIDILLYDYLSIHTPLLTIPHPLMCQRDFVMIPLCEILPVSFDFYSRHTQYSCHQCQKK